MCVPYYCYYIEQLSPSISNLLSHLFNININSTGLFMAPPPNAHKYILSKMVNIKY